jgi:long-chain acyl-CoA synthetase
MLNMSCLLEDAARKFPDRDAVVHGETRLTYAEVDAAANQVANLLIDCGIRRGDKIALSCPNVPAFPIVYYGAIKAGAVIVPLNILLKAREISYHLRDAEAKAYFCFQDSDELPLGTEGWSAFNEADGCSNFFVITDVPTAPSPIDGASTLANSIIGKADTFDAVVTEATDTAIILYTSGTTGHPKGAELSHANIMMNVLTCNLMFQNRPAQDTHLLTLPLFHSFGATVQMHGGFSMAATLHLIPRFDAAVVVDIMQREAITFFAGVPTMWWGLINALDGAVDVRRIASNLRIGISGGASLPVELLNEVKDKLGIQILEGYGLSETSPVATFSDPLFERRPGSIGRPIWGIELKLLEPDGTEVLDEGAIGEIAVKGHCVMKAYYNRPDATAEVIQNGWFRTGDLGRRDADGFYYIVDRSKDMIIRGGFNVYPREIEEVLMTHAAVSLAAVVGTPHESHGEEVKAFVILKPGAVTTEAELINWGREQLAAYKYPRSYEIVDSLPMTATGKILKRELV